MTKNAIAMKSTLEEHGVDAPRNRTTMNYALWTIQVLLALLFLFTGSMKLILPVAELTKQISLPGPLLRFIGTAEIFGAIGLILPGLLRIRPLLTPLAAAGLAIIVTGATVLTLTTGAAALALIPLTAGLLSAFVAYGRLTSAPDTFRVQRAKSIQAPPEEIAALIGDFHRWGAWSPYEKLDPAMQRSYSGAANGKGAVYEWAGNGKAGQGRMEIADTSPSNITIQLDFLKPFQCRNTAEFTLEAKGDSTNVTWAMHGAQSNFCKLMSIFFNMDRLIGKDFEAGLDNMKAIAEGQAQRSLVCS
jgi:hypothetical protein